MVARTPFARARGLGASGSGTREYWMLKLSSVAVLVLSVFLIGLLVALKGGGHEAARQAVASPLVAIALFLFVLTNAIHMRLGMQNIIDDYVHGKNTKKLAVGANLFFSWGLAVAAFYLLVVIGLRG